MADDDEPAADTRPVLERLRDEVDKTPPLTLEEVRAKVKLLKEQLPLRREEAKARRREMERRRRPERRAQERARREAKRQRGLIAEMMGLRPRRDSTQAAKNERDPPPAIDKSKTDPQGQLPLEGLSGRTSGESKRDAED